MESDIIRSCIYLKIFPGQGDLMLKQLSIKNNMCMLDNNSVLHINESIPFMILFQKKSILYRLYKL